MGLSDFAGGIQSGVQSGASTAFNTISSVQNYINGVSNSYIINPAGMKGIAGFVFDYEGDDEIRLESEIPDHYSENKTAIQDHIANRPPRIVLRGFVSELYLPPTNQGVRGALNGLPTLTTLVQKMGTVGAYLGKYTPQQLQKLTSKVSGAVTQVMNYTNTASQYLNQAKNLAALFGGGTGAPTRQQQAYVALSQLWEQKQIFNVLTPWTLLPNMAIETLVFVQPKDSKTRSDITVTMKQMRFIDVDINGAAAANAKRMARAATQIQSKLSLGLTSGTPIPAGVAAIKF